MPLQHKATQAMEVCDEVHVNPTQGLWHPQKQFADPGPWLKYFTYRYCLFTAKCRNSSYTFSQPMQGEVWSSGLARDCYIRKIFGSIDPSERNCSQAMLCAATEVTGGTAAAGQAGEARNCSVESSPDHVWHIIYLLLLQVSLAKEAGERSVAQRAVYFPAEWTILDEQDQSTRMKTQPCLAKTNKKIR